MAGYAYLMRVRDADTRLACQKLFDRIEELQKRVIELEGQQTARSTSLDAGGLRVLNVASPQADSDAVNLATLRSYVAGQVEAFS